MAVYVVMEPPGRGHDADATTFVRDGFSWPAFLVPPLWLLWHRMWVEAALTVVVIGAFLALGGSAGLQPAVSLLTLFVMLYIGLEGQALRVSSLSRRGFRQWGVVVADNLDDAETRYAVEASAHQPQPTSPEPRPVSAVPLVARPASGGSIGLVPFSGKH